ncbi:MAG: DUF5908 family protein [Panacibacter sp.]
MPIIISEIEIAIEVIPTSGSQTSGLGSATNIASKEDIIKECVEKVMEILNQKKER